MNTDDRIFGKLVDQNKKIKIDPTPLGDRPQNILRKGQILSKEDGQTKRNLKEAVFMAATPQSISPRSLELHKLWMPLVRKCVRFRQKMAIKICVTAILQK